MDTEYGRKLPIGVLGSEFDMFSYAKKTTNFVNILWKLRITTKSHALKIHMCHCF